MNGMKKVVIATFPMDSWGTQVQHWYPTMNDVPKNAIRREMSWSTDGVWKPVQNESKRKISK
jgi:hypothetical protein